MGILGDLFPKKKAQRREAYDQKLWTGVYNTPSPRETPITVNLQRFYWQRHKSYDKTDLYSKPYKDLHIALGRSAYATAAKKHKIDNLPTRDIQGLTKVNFVQRGVEFKNSYTPGYRTFQIGTPPHKPQLIRSNQPARYAPSEASNEHIIRNSLGWETPEYHPQAGKYPSKHEITESKLDKISKTKGLGEIKEHARIIENNPYPFDDYEVIEAPYRTEDYKSEIGRDTEGNVGVTFRRKRDRGATADSGSDEQIEHELDELGFKD